MRKRRLSLEDVLLACAVAITAATLVLALGWPRVWEPLSKEDTGPEAATVLALLLLAGVAIVRVRRLPRGARAPSIVLVAISLLAAGEEASWGQRVLGFEAPRFFAEHNVQAETNLHNLIPPPFDFLLGLLVLAAFAAAPALATHPVGRALVRRGVPWPERRHVKTLLACALPAGVLAAAGVQGLEELVELVAVLVATAVVSSAALASPSRQPSSKDAEPDGI